MMRCSNAACFFTNESKVGPSKAFIERGIVGDGREDVHVRVGIPKRSSNPLISLTSSGAANAAPV